jgi:lipopolysaccharide/colanic/teichoic acid biosynthesis glycosyltransferase
MSLVGPRPELPALAATFDLAIVGERLTVRPGITGPWQVSTASARLIGEAPELDRLYLTPAGPRLNAWVSLRTVGGLVGRRPLPLERFPGWVRNRSAPIGVRRAGFDGAAQTTKNETVEVRRQTASSS